MAIDIAAVQQALREQGLDGWLLYDFHGSNPIATRLAGLTDGRKLATRRWYYLIPREGEPTAVVHAIERHNLDELPGVKREYAGRAALERELAATVQGLGKVAMEYSPRCEIPYLARVDAGTVELLRQFGVDVVSSGDLAQQFEAVWSDEAVVTHRQASEALYAIKDLAFEEITRRIADGRPTTEYEVQQMMLGWFRDHRLETSSPPVVAVGPSGGNPHYQPTATDHRPVERGQVVLLDLWGKVRTRGSVYADITWMGYTGRDVPDEVTRAFETIRDAREAAVTLVRTSAAEHRDLRGWQVDRAARDLIQAAGYGDHFLHRTGHSLGDEVHGNGVHMDDYETHDDRRLLPGTGFTIEPGLYFETFGVRTEINMVYGDGDAFVTGPRQTDIVRLA